MLRYAITDRTCLSPNRSGALFIRRTLPDEWEDALVSHAAALAARGDIDYLQLREKDLPPAALATLARRILEALRASQSQNESQSGPFMRGHQDSHEWGSKDHNRPRLLINSRADIALAVRADGVHLTSSPGELTPAQVRALYSSAGLPPPVVSLSCHTLADVIAARGPHSEDELCFAPDPAATPDLILFGPVFEKRVGGELISSPGPEEGLALLRQACAAASPIPVLALGGITEENTPACLAAGASGIAGIRLFLG
ncbi:MAG TPA: thiamine phosphate synthase [Acidobacteriaceae bacterium]|nr:thiamine phosphate synthase [Acidobacteriaceae bacterium]